MTRPAAPSPWPLELGEPDLRELTQGALDRVVRHLARLDDQPTHATRGAARLRSLVSRPLPEQGSPPARLWSLLFDHVLPRSLHTASPGYLAYVPGGGLLSAAVADFVALATNRYVGVDQAAPLLAELERTTLRWLADVVGLPPGAGGVFTTGGSLANLTAVVAARVDRLPALFQEGVLYASDQVHHSVTKAARAAGLLPERVKLLPCDERGRLDVAALASAIERDRAAGLRPFCVVASAGTTNTGAVDDLSAVADVVEREGLWLHVDAAYGGFFALTERGRRALAGLERAHSVTLDPHKGLFLPYGTGCLLVREPAALRRAFAASADYLPPASADGERIDFADLGLELSREARGLRVWLPLSLHGACAFRAALDEKLDLAQLFAHELAQVPGVELAAESPLSVVVFRHRPHGSLGDDALDRHQRALLSRVHRGRRAFLSSTLVGGRVVLRACVLSFRTHERHVRACVDEVRRAITEAGD